MSNCLDLRNGIVVFNADDIDILKLKELLDASKKEDQNNYKDAMKYLVSWFLWANTSLTENSVTIEFGLGESSHTFRDFAQTINIVLKPLMKRSKIHVFIARDAENPQTGWFKWLVDFQKGIDR